MDSFTSSKNVLILLSPTLSKHVLYLVTALETLLTRSGKSVTLLLENKDKEGTIGNDLQKIIQDRKILNLSVIDKLQPKRTVISVNKGNAKVKNVLWKEEGEELKFQIESVADNFEIKDVDFKTSGTDADTVIFIGCKEINDLSHLYSINPTLFTNAFSINLDNKKGNLRFAKSNYVIEDETFTKVFMSFVKDNSLSLSSQDSSLFLQTLLLETKVFTLGLEKSEGIFETVLELIKLGANYTEALNNYTSITKDSKPSVSEAKVPTLFIPTPKNVVPSLPQSIKRPEIRNVPSTNTNVLDKIFPKAGNREPESIKVDQTQSNIPLFTPYSAPKFNTKPVYKEYQGFVPNNPPVSTVGKSK